MALLSRFSNGQLPGPRGRLAVFGSLAALAITGCAVFQYLGLSEKPLAFSHEKHLAEGLSCTDCHSAYEDGDVVQAVNPAQCALCHDELDSEKTPDRQVASLFDGDEFRATRASALSDEVKFSHATHVGSGASCESCHEPILTNSFVEASVSPRMDDCIKCHESVGQDASCTVCHTQINTDSAPPNHSQQWMTAHGVAVRGGLEGPANDCTLCHTDRTCITCHQDQPPANHNNFWRLRGHGVVADMDRDACRTCHEPSSCVRCHNETEPLNHTASWGSPQDTHCMTCHYPLQSESCSVCHKSTPSHLDAAEQPPNHFPGMDCRACHGVNAPLPHFDNGDDCTFCHK